MTLSRRLAAETMGTGFLLATVVGSGIMGERLANGNVAIALLANSIATGAALIALIILITSDASTDVSPLTSRYADTGLPATVASTGWEP